MVEIQASIMDGILFKWYISKRYLTDFVHLFQRSFDSTLPGSSPWVVFLVSQARTNFCFLFLATSSSQAVPFSS